MSCANTNLPECIMGTYRLKPVVSQKIHVEIGDTPKNTISRY